MSKGSANEVADTASLVIGALEKAPGSSAAEIAEATVSVPRTPSTSCDLDFDSGLPRGEHPAVTLSFLYGRSAASSR